MHISPDEQYTTVDKYSIAACFNPNVFVNCLQDDLKQLTKTFGLKRVLRLSIHQQLCIAHEVKFTISIATTKSLYRIKNAKL